MESSAANGGTVLVTGGSGFLGGWCVVELLRRGYDVRTTIRNKAREPELRSKIEAQLDSAERLSVAEADLMSDDGWEQAVSGCDYVLHVASPFPATQPKDPDELIVPAREGTLRVLGASLDGGAKRVVITSSIAAIDGGGLHGGKRPMTENDWTDPDNPKITPYVRSKTIAELAAWDHARSAGATERVTTVNPGAIIGPVLDEHRSYSLQTIERMLGGVPAIPRLGFSFVDVRDVADLQIRAMTSQEAGGERFIATDQFLWMSQIAEVLRERMGDAAKKVPKRNAPDFLLRAMALFDSELRSVVPNLGKSAEYSSEKARTKLGWSPRPVEDSIIDCARSLVNGAAK